MLIHKNTNLDMHGWELESAVERHREHPETFPIPSERDRSSLEFGDRVKLLFLFVMFDEQYPDGIATCERMWVTIIDAQDSEFTGLLESTPRSSNVLQPDDVLGFQSMHVCEIAPKPDPVRFAEFQSVLRSYLTNMNPPSISG